MVAEFSYEDLYEFLRAEKYSTDLQPIATEQLQKVRRYFKTKEDFLAQQAGTGFDEALDKVKTELDNAKRALRDLYDKRERKVISRALLTARGGFKFKDATNMLVSEEKLYFTLLEMLKASNAEFFELIDNMDFSHAAEQQKPLKEDFKRVKLLEDVPELMDTKLNRYGPYNTGTVIELPTELADLLLAQSKATVEVETRQ
jgi:DNA replication initiation complex subunit (GINS family)